MEIGERGFEPPTSASRTQRSSQAEPLPEISEIGIYHIKLQKASYNKLTGSISIEIFTAGLIGLYLRSILKNLCIGSAFGDWAIIWFL